MYRSPVSVKFDGCTEAVAALVVADTADEYDDRLVPSSSIVRTFA